MCIFPVAGGAPDTEQFRGKGSARGLGLVRAAAVGRGVFGVRGYVLKVVHRDDSCGALVETRPGEEGAGVVMGVGSEAECGRRRASC